MNKKIECDVTPTSVEFQGRDVLGVRVTCSACDHWEEAGGRSARSVRKCLAMLRENCPEGEKNFYVADEE